jgi:hypothetical protein
MEIDGWNHKKIIQFLVSLELHKKGAKLKRNVRLEQQSGSQSRKG